MRAEHAFFVLVCGLLVCANATLCPRLLQRRLDSQPTWCGKPYNVTFMKSHSAKPATKAAILDFPYSTDYSPAITLHVVPNVEPYTSETNGQLLVRITANGKVAPLLYFKAFLSEDGTILTSGELYSQIQSPAYSLFDFSVALLPSNTTSNVTCDLSDDTGYVLASTIIQLRRFPSRTDGGSCVKINHLSGGLLLEGEGPSGMLLPFFPSGFFFNFGDNPAAFVSAADGFNSIVVTSLVADGVYNKTQQKQLLELFDRAAAIGMKIQYYFGGLAEEPSSASKYAGLQATLELVSSHPALLSYYLADEPDGTGVSPELLREAYEYIKFHDPYHPVTINLNCQTTAANYSIAADILSSDPYPIGIVVAVACDECTGTVVDVATRIAAFVAQVNNTKPIWLIPQAFSLMAGDHWERAPSRQEAYAMVYLALVHGATAATWFTLSTPRLAREQWERNEGAPIVLPTAPALWDAMGTLAAEMSELTPFVLNAAGVVQVKPSTPDVHVAGWLAENIAGYDVVTVACVNALNTPTVVQLSLGNVIGGYHGNESALVVSTLSDVSTTATVLFENREITIADGVIVDVLGGFDRHVYQFTLSPVAQMTSAVVYNPSFELQHNVGTADGIALCCATDLAATALVDSRVAHDGLHSLRLVTPAPHAGLVAYPYLFPNYFWLPDGGMNNDTEVLEVSLYAVSAPPAPGTAPPTLEICLGTPQHTVGGGPECSSFKLSTEWTQLALRTGALGRSNQLELAVTLAGRGTAWLDSLNTVASST